MTVPTFMHPFARPCATDFLCIVRGEGAIVYDDRDRDFIDATSALWFCSVGHGRREIAEAVAGQLGALGAFHTFDRFTNQPADSLAEVLAANAPMPGARVFFTNGGSEAADTVIKLARIARALGNEPKRQTIVSVEGAFHGVTYGGLSAGGVPENRVAFGRALHGMIHVPRNDLTAMKEVLDARGEEVTAVLLEPVPGAAGVYPPDENYLRGLRRLCDDAGAWLILDEVITGFGRLGTMWGAERYGIRPDMVMFAKGVTSGYFPLGGVLIGEPVRERLEADASFLLRHGFTYSGHPAGCAAGLANLVILEREDLISQVPRLGKLFAGGLGELVDEGLLAEARGDGLMWAAGLHSDANAVAVRESMLAVDRVLVRAIGTDTIAFSPPYVTSDEQVSRCVSALRTALSRTTK